MCLRISSKDPIFFFFISLEFSTGKKDGSVKGYLGCLWGNHTQLAKPAFSCIELLKTCPKLHYPKDLMSPCWNPCGMLQGEGRSQRGEEARG